MKTKHPIEGEWVQHGDKAIWKCCDCGMEHEVYFKIDNMLAVKMFRVKRVNAGKTKKQKR